MTQEFRVSVTPLGGDEYLVRTEWREPGVPLAEEQVTWPVDEWLAQASVLMNDPLIGVLRGDTLHSLPASGKPPGILTHPGPLSASLVELGQQLYQALFQKTMRDSWMTARGIAQHRQEILRLRLGLKDLRLPRLPWEVLYEGDRPLATGTDVVFSRYHSSFDSHTSSLRFPPIAASDADQPLRILLVLAAPTDQETLALKQEALHLQEELHSARRQSGSGGRSPDIELTILDQPGREQLTQTLEHSQYQVFHYAGHSNLGTSGGNLYLVSSRTGLTETLSGDDLAGLLVNNGIRMAVFNSCRGGYTAVSEAGAEDGNLVEALVKRGIPAVLAMAERIPDDVALNLSRLFYRNLKQGYSIDLSLNRARQGLIASYTSNQLYWALPVLYLHPKFDGYLQSSDLNERDRLADLLIENAADLDLPRAPGAQAALGLHDSDPYGLEEFEDYYNEETLPEPLKPGSARQNDTATIAQLIDQLSHPTTPEERPLPAPPGENLLPDLQREFRPDYPLLPEDPRYTPPPVTVSTPPRATVSSTIASTSTTLTPTDVDMYSDLEQLLADAGKLTDAIAACNQAIQINPNNADAYHQLGMALAEQGYLAEAITAYNQALQINPLLADAHHHLGKALAEQGNLHQAILEYNCAIQLNPSLKEAYENLGVVLQKQGADPTVLEQHQRQAQALERTTPSRVTQRPGAAVAQSAAPSSLRSRSPQKHAAQGRFPKKPLLWAGAGAMSVAVLLGGWVAYDRLTRPPVEVRFTGPSPSTAENVVDLGQSGTGDVTRQAIEQLNQGNIPAARQSIEALLDRNALSFAATVFASKAVDDPGLLFLMGRLSWQSVRVGDPNFSLNDALRAFDQAARKQPNPLYQNALGFTFYERGEIKQAGRAWYKALQQLGERGATPKGAEKSASPASKEALTAYAGIALMYMKSAENQPPSKQAELRSQAIQLRQKVMSDDPKNFVPDALAKNWMWSEKAIRDWRSLQALK